MKNLLLTISFGICCFLFIKSFRNWKLKKKKINASKKLNPVDYTLFFQYITVIIAFGLMSIAFFFKLVYKGI